MLCESPQVERLRVIAADIKTSKNRITDILNKAKTLDEGEGDRIQYFLHILRVFETESLVHLKEWNQISQIVQVRNIDHAATLLIAR